MGDPSTVPTYNVPIVERLGPRPFEHLPPGNNHTYIIQTFGPGNPEVDVEFCDLRGWGVSQQCAKANIYGFHVGDENADRSQPWLPLPVLGEYSGIDRMVKFDVYASTDRVYVFVEDKPSGCAVIPAGHFPAGPVNVAFGVASYHIDADEFVTRENPRFEYWSRYSKNHTERRFDDLGIKSGASLPTWNETLMPCGSEFYGAQ